MATSVIRSFVAKAIFKKKGAIANKKAVEFSANALEKRLISFGIDPNSIRSEQELNQILNLVKQAEDQAFNQRFGDVLSRSNLDRKGEVFDMTGKKIDPSKGIMGGKQVENTTGSLMSVPNKKGLAGMEYDLPPPGSRGGPDDIAAPFQSSDESLKSMIEAENKKNISKMKNRKMVKDAVDNVSPGFVKGDRKYNAQLVADDLAEKRFNKDFYDLDQKQQTDIYGEALDGYDELTRGGMPDPEDFAQGGRAGYKFGLGPLFNFLNKKSPMKAYTDYLESVKTRMKAGKEAEVAGEVIPIAAGGALITNQLKKKLKAMNEEQKKKIEKEAQEELRKDMKKAEGGRIGYFMGGPNPKGLGLLRQVLNYMSKKGVKEDRFKGVDLSGVDMLRLSNPKRFNKMLEDVRGKVNIREGIMGTDTVRAQQEALRAQRKGLTEKSLDVAKAMKADDDKIKIRLAKEAETTIIPQVKKSLMEGMGMSEEAAEKAARDMAKAAQNIKPIDAPPEITKKGILQLENVLKNMETGGKKKRDLNATGGRIGFKDGMSRRTFLKLLGGLASIPIIGKIVKPIKLAKGVKNVPIIKTENVAGKPEWFDALVNKVIIEGDDVTKKFATAERQSIHQKTLDDGSLVRVTEDVDDGAVRVEYESKESMFGEPVQMEYKKPLPDEGAPDPTPEFTTSESGIVGRADGPDDFYLEAEEVGGSSIRDLDSDVSKLKQYATGKGPTIKEIVEIKKRKDKVKKLSEGDPDATSQYVTDRQGDYDPSPDDFASGGIARMLGE